MVLRTGSNQRTATCGEGTCCEIVVSRIQSLKQGREGKEMDVIDIARSLVYGVGGLGVGDTGDRLDWRGITNA